MLRRTKLERADDLNLPPRRIRIRRDYFSPAEFEFYESLFKETSRQFSTYVQSNTVLNNYANIFELITRMRLAVNHPDMLRIAREKKNMNGMVSCGMCHEEAEDPIQSRCKHVFCRACTRQYLEFMSNGIPMCPTCYQKLT